jgi:hypothetical protein
MEETLITNAIRGIRKQRKACLTLAGFSIDCDDHLLLLEKADFLAQGIDALKGALD